MRRWVAGVVLVASVGLGGTAGADPVPIVSDETNFPPPATSPARPCWDRVSALERQVGRQLFTGSGVRVRSLCLKLDPAFR